MGRKSQGDLNKEKTENSISSVVLIFIDSVTVHPYTNKKPVAVKFWK
jgi:hypothetical protein